MQAMCEDFGGKKGLEVHTDARSGKAIAQRRGLGPVRHISTRFLWVQQKISQKEFSVTKVKGKSNPADLGTKYLNGPDLSRILKDLVMRRSSEPLEGALKANK